MFSKNSELQKQFDEKYISANEIATYLNMTRVAVFRAVESGRLPEAPITVGAGQGIKLWLRNEISATLIDWKNKRNVA